MEPEKLDQVIELLTKIDEKMSQLADFNSPASSPIPPPIISEPPPSEIKPLTPPNTFFTRRIGDRGDPPLTPPQVDDKTPSPIVTIGMHFEQYKTELAEHTQAANAEAEFTLGSRILPWTGAITFIIAMITLVTMAIKRGWIGPEIQFAMSIGLCSIMTLVGIRSKADHFIGQLITGLGICGMYLSFAGGYATWKLFGGEILVTAFSILSLSVLALGWKRQSAIWVSLGTIGGSAAATMPVHRGDIGAAMLINMAILLPAAWIIWRQKWSSMAMGLAVTNFCVTLFIVFSHTDKLAWINLQLYLLVCAFIGIAINVDITNEEDQSIPTVIASSLACLTVIAAATLHWHPISSIPLLCFSGVLILLGQFRKPNTLIRKVIVLTAWGIVLCYIPHLFAANITFLIEIALCLGLLYVSMLKRNRWLLAAGWIEFVLASINYIRIASEPVVGSGLNEAFSVLLLFVALGLGTVASRNTLLEEGQESPVSWAITFAGWVLASRFGYLISETAGLSVSWSVYGVALIPIGFALGQRAFRFSSFLVLAVTLMKVMFVDLSDVDPVIRVLILIPLSLALIGLSYFFYWGPNALQFKTQSSTEN